MPTPRFSARRPRPDRPRLGPVGHALQRHRLCRAPAVDEDEAAGLLQEVLCRHRGFRRGGRDQIGHGWDQLGTRSSDTDCAALRQSMKMRPLDYFKKFYADTAVFGAAAATRCGLSFFGVDQVLFGSDTPFEPQPGVYIRETIDVLDRLEITGDERDRIYWKNAQRMLRLEVK